MDRYQWSSRWSSRILVRKYHHIKKLFSKFIIRSPKHKVRYPEVHDHKPKIGSKWVWSRSWRKPRHCHCSAPLLKTLESPQIKFGALSIFNGSHLKMGLRKERKKDISWPTGACGGGAFHFKFVKTVRYSSLSVWFCLYKFLLFKYSFLCLYTTNIILCSFNLVLLQ